jgi:hypothetical protein
MQSVSVRGQAMATASEPGTSRRSRRSIIALSLIALTAIGGGILVMRLTSLHGLPDIGDPFDVSAHRQLAIPDDENAYTFYRRAIAQLAKDEPRSMKGAYRAWSEVDEAQLRWLHANGQALETWLEGTKRERALQLLASETTIDELLPVTRKIYTFLRLANLKAFKLQHEGDLDGSWTWLRGNLRMSRHSGMNGFLIERMVGYSAFNATVGQVTRWSEDPRVDASLLRRALEDLLVIDRLTPSHAECLRNEYISLMKTLADPDHRDRALAQEYQTPEQITPKELARYRLGSTLATLGCEPERSRRVIRLVVANWLTALKLTSAERADRVVKIGNLTLYRPAPGESSPISVEELARWFESTRYAKHFLIGNVFAANGNPLREEGERAALIVHVAEQLYLREHGELPETAEALVGPYLKHLPGGYVPPTDASNPQGALK